MLKKLVFLLLLNAAYLQLNYAQNMIDSSYYNKVGTKKNVFFIEAGGSSSLVGIYYQRNFPFLINRKPAAEFRLQVGFSPFTFFIFNISDGISIPGGFSFAFFKGRFKLGVGCMFLNSFYFNNNVYYKDDGYSPAKEIVTGYKLFLQPQVYAEYHFSQKFVGKLAFTPTFMPGYNLGKFKYDFMPWGGISVGYKF